MITVESWQPADNLMFEPTVLLAIKEQQRCLALTAGPGAGKTEMLAQRADFLLRTGTCRYPKRILAISFKVDACKNLKERVQQRCGPDLASRFESHTFHAFAKRIIDQFRLVLTGEDALDAGYKIVERMAGPSRTEIEFADLMLLAIEILKKSKVARNAIRQTYSDVFLDEFQDCTDNQYKLVQLAFKDTTIRLIAVGDTKQKIMGWAGALEGVFRTFAADFAATSLNMYRNFRSKPRLLRMQNEIIRVIDPASVMPHELIVGDEGEVFAWRCKNDYEEAEYLANLIADWINREKLPPAEIAVLIRNQLELYAAHLMTALEARGIPFRNEQQLQDITTEPVARLIVDYLSCLYSNREPKAWVRLMNQVIPFADDEIQSNVRQDFNRLIKQQRKEAAIADQNAKPFSGWWEFAIAFLKQIRIEAVVALSPEYESGERLKDLILNTKARIEELLKLEPDLPKALERFSDDKAVRILTIHKSKGLEFDSVIIMAVENEIFFGNQNENRCAYFVGVSRAKRRLVLTCVDQRERPVGAKRWDIRRSAQDEYFSYALPFVRQQQ